LLEIGYPFRRMTRASRALLAVLLLGLPLPALAQSKGGGGAQGTQTTQATQPSSSASSTEPLTADQVKAQQHFQHAKDLYQAGSYRDAIGELEAARALDPKAKDLVFNLGIVNEKLLKFDEAIANFREYLEMDGVSAQEKQKAESIIKRIEGAKREAATTTPPAASSTASGTVTVGPGQPSRAEGERPENGRIDTATIAAASVSALGLGIGTVFGIRALAMRPTDFVTGRDGSYDDLKDKTDSAHTSAIIADVGFGLGIAAGAAAAWLYFTRPKVQTAGFAPAPLPGGAAMLFGGSFR